MPISIQGNWTVRVVVRNINSLPQRFSISGASAGNGTYVGDVSTPAVLVTGQNWSVNIQANEDYDFNGQWLNSSMRVTPTETVGNQYVFRIESEDLVQDNSWDDCVLEFTQPVPAPPSPTPPPTPPPR